MFVDELKVKIIGGKGGNGCTAFRREKFVPQGGPSGGNGGDGGNIIFEADEGLRTLLDLTTDKIIKGNKGSNGEGKNKHGACGEDLIVKVPLGTVVYDIRKDRQIADLVRNGQREIIAKGGKGGRGNRSFATGNNPAPSISENGEDGEEILVKIELKLLADVGLVGMPSVGKSTILSIVSASKPKIADYHFTTLTPNLGVVKTMDNRSFVMADLPGLIKGASLGEGLGDKFLKHIERTKVICHVVDMGAAENRNPYEDYLLINKELEDFDPKLLEKPQIIVANKMDLEKGKKNLIEFKKKVKDILIFEISAATNKGLDKVLIELANLVESESNKDQVKIETNTDHVLYEFKKEEPYRIIKDGDVFVIKGKEIERIFKKNKFENQESFLRFSKTIKKMGIENDLLDMGAEDGDIIRILDSEFEFRV